MSKPAESRGAFAIASVFSGVASVARPRPESAAAGFSLQGDQLRAEGLRAPWASLLLAEWIPSYQATKSRRIQIRILCGVPTAWDHHPGAAPRSLEVVRRLRSALNVKGCLKITLWTVGALIVIPLLIVLFTYFFFRPTGKTPVNLAMTDSAGRPVPNATLTFVEWGERLLIPIPFGPTRRVERTFEEQTDTKGFCRFYVRDQHCDLTRIEVAGEARRILSHTDYRGEHSHTNKKPRVASWRLAAPPYEYKAEIVIE